MLPLARNRAARSIPAPAARSQRSSTRSLVCIRALYGKGEAMKSVGDGVWPCALAAYAKRFARAARARATLDAYASDLADFERFCALHGLAALPAAPQTVGRYVSVLATTGPAIPRLRRDRGGAAAVVRPAAVSTIRRRLEGELHEAVYSRRMRLVDPQQRNARDSQHAVQKEFHPTDVISRCCRVICASDLGRLPALKAISAQPTVWA